MKVVFLMKVVFDESGFDEIDHFHPNFDESEPNPSVVRLCRAPLSSASVVRLCFRCEAVLERTLLLDPIIFDRWSPGVLSWHQASFVTSITQDTRHSATCCSVSALWFLPLSQVGRWPRLRAAE